MKILIVAALVVACSFVLGCKSKGQTARHADARAGSEVCPRPCEFSGGNAGIGSYSAYQQKGMVWVVAEGKKPGSAYRVCLAPGSLTIFPPEFHLRWKSMGTGDAMQTFYRVANCFRAEKQVTSVKVHDRDGSHRVPVKQVNSPDDLPPDLQTLSSRHPLQDGRLWVDAVGTVRKAEFSTGSEGTGYIITILGFTWDLDLSRDPEWARLADRGDGRLFHVKGPVKKHGVEDPDRTVLRAEFFKPVK